MTTPFRGRFQCKVDQKGRMSMPKAYSEILPATEKSSHNLVVTNSLFQGKKCLDVYTMEEWQKLEQKISRMPALKKEVQAYQRFYLSSGQPISADAQGRIVIPSSLRQYAGLKDEVSLVGMGHKFEVWAGDLWTDLFEDLTESYEDVLSAVADLEEKLGEES